MSFGQPPGGGWGQPPGGNPPPGGGNPYDPGGGGAFGPPGGAPPSGGGAFGPPGGGYPPQQNGFGQPPSGGAFGPPGGAPMGGPGGPQNDPVALASIGSGAVSLLIGLVGCCIPCVGWLSFPFSFIAIGAGAFSLVRQNKEPEKYGGKPLAIAGIALGAVWMVLYLIWTIVIVGMMGAGSFMEQMN
jgi:hypothetical protein